MDLQHLLHFIPCMLVKKQLTRNTNFHYVQSKSFQQIIVLAMENRHPNPKKRDQSDRFYPYLSIDETNKLQPHREGNTHESLDYLNIKFDTKTELREVCLRSFKEKLAAKLFRDSRESNLSKVNDEKEPQTTLMKKKTLNPQTILRTSAERMGKDAAAAHHHSISLSSHHNKKSIKSQDDIHQPNEGFCKPKQFSINDKGKVEQYKAKPKKHFFQKMLKKCEHLKEIYKYEAELINISEIQQENPIRFYTEPIKFPLQLDQSNHPQRRERSIKITLSKQVPEMRNQHKQKPTSEYGIQTKTLEVRQYRNESSTKQRMKYLFRKQLMKYEYSRSDKKGSCALKKGKRLETIDRDVVGPWDAEQSFCFSKET